MCIPSRIACQRGRVVPAGTYPPIPSSATPTELGCGDSGAAAASARVLNANHEAHSADLRAGEAPRQITRVNVATMELQTRMIMMTGLVTLAADRQGPRHCDGWPTPSTSAPRRSPRWSATKTACQSSRRTAERLQAARPYAAGRLTSRPVEPTVCADVDNSNVITREEIFGPVVTITPYADDDDAVRVANDCDYGLAGAVWTTDDQRGSEMARRSKPGPPGSITICPTTIRRHR
jgi:hypothetical protein